MKARWYKEYPITSGDLIEIESGKVKEEQFTLEEQVFRFEKRRNELAAGPQAFRSG